MFNGSYRYKNCCLYKIFQRGCCLLRDRYINIFTSFGFYNIFGKEENKDVFATSFTNSFDIPHRQYGKPDEWNFELEGIYTIGIFGFRFNDQDKDKTVVSNVQFMNTMGKKGFDGASAFVYLQLPNFTKNEDELNTRLDCWLYSLQNLHKLYERPKKMDDKIFKKPFEISEISRIQADEQEAYEVSLKYYRDLKNSIDFAYEEGVIAGKLKKAQALMLAGCNDDTIARVIDLLAIEDIPVIACPHCKETYMTAETMHEIERIKLHRKSMSKKRQIAVAEFA